MEHVKVVGFRRVRVPLGKGTVLVEWEDGAVPVPFVVESRFGEGDLAAVSLRLAKEADIVGLRRVPSPPDDAEGPEEGAAAPGPAPEAGG